MKNTQSIQEYGELLQLAPDLFAIDGEWYGTPFRRRMTLMRLKSGGLVIHGAIRLKETDYSKIDSLGRVEYIVVANQFHDSEAHYYKMRYPSAKLFVSKGAEKAVREKCMIDGVLPEAWPTHLSADIEVMEFQGTRRLHENVFLHKASRALILTDLVFNLQQDVSGEERVLFRLNRIYKRFGPSRIFRYVFVKNPQDAALSLREMMKWDFDRVVMSHGQILHTGGKRAMETSFSEMGLA